jgi:pimeloyl-ACP methyl ester carboxylesterase
MIPVFLAAGARVVAPDWFGFGRSDKPADDAAYTFSFHRSTALRLIEKLGLRRITLVCQDWGGLLGLTLPMEMPDRFARLLVMNTGLAVGKPISAGFAAWKAFAASYHHLPVAGLVALSSPGALNPYDAAAYDAPFPDASYQAGVRRFPQLVAVEPGMEGVAFAERARKFLAEAWRGESFMAIGLRDPVLGKPVMEELRSVIRGCPPALEVPEAGHFVQEWGEPVARAALAAFSGGKRS